MGGQKRKDIENTRTNLHLKINESEKLTDSKVVKVSEEMDQKVLEEMLRQDPKIENNYLKRVIKAKDIQIANLENENTILKTRLKDLIELAVMNVEAGLTIKRALEILKSDVMKEGILNDTKFHAAR